MNSKMTFTATSLLLAGALAVSYGCASSSDDSGSSGSSGSNSSNPSGGSGGGGGGGGSSSSKPAASGDSVTFNTGKAEGLFTGYGWVALGEKDSLSSPTCDRSEPTITKGTPCDTTTKWSKTDALCMTGSIPALPASPAQTDYDSNWGVQIGVNATDPSGAIGDALSGYKTVTFTLSGSPSSGLRAMLHRKDDPDGTTYCADSIKSGTAITLEKFNTKCWGDTTTVKFDVADLSKVDKIGVQVSSGSSSIDVKDLCLEKVEFGGK